MSNVDNQKHQNELCEENTQLQCVYNIEKKYDLKSVNGDEIIRILNQTIISEEEAEAVVLKIISDLKTALKDYFVYECLPFGSYINGLRSEDSDLDICLRISPLISSEEQKPVLNKIKKLLSGNKSVFSNVFSIPKAKVPIVKFKHIVTSVDCDLSLDNEIGVQNTFLIKSYLSMNLNLKLLVLILKYLLTRYDLRGSGKFTTYVIFWLVVFYMQQKDLLPPVMNARESSSDLCIISGWNCSIPSSLPMRIEDPYSAPYHLQKFCEFYYNFNWSNFVICPYLACEIPVENFISLKLPPKCFHSYLEKIENATESPFPIHIINLQDPTSLTINLTRPLSPTTLAAFKAFCNNIRDSLSQNVSEKFIDILKCINRKSLPLTPLIRKKRKKRKIKAEVFTRPVRN